MALDGRFANGEWGLHIQAMMDDDRFEWAADFLQDLLDNGERYGSLTAGQKDKLREMSDRAWFDPAPED